MTCSRKNQALPLLLTLWIAAALAAPVTVGAEEVAMGSLRQFVGGETAKLSVAYDAGSGALIAQAGEGTLTFLIKPGGALCYDKTSASFVDAGKVLRDADGRIWAEFFGILPSDISIENIVALMGKPHRDVGSGGAILQWDFSDGSKVQVQMALLNGAVSVIGKDAVCTRIMANGAKQPVYVTKIQ